MKALVLIFSLLMVTNSAHAAESLMELIEKTFEQLKTPGVFDPSCNCYVGRDTQVNETESLVCKDLYEGACQFEDDKKKRINGKLKESQTQLIYDAFDVAAKAAGHKDFKSAYLKRLTEAGLARVDDITLSRMKELFELDPYVSEYSADKYFKEVAKCKADAKALEEKTEDYDEEDDIEELESIRNRIQIFQKDQNDQIEKLFVETPTDLYDSIREECDDLRDDLDEILEKPFIDQPKKIPDMPSVCGSKSLYQMKTQAIDLFRQSDSPDILEKRKAFVRKLMPTLLLLKPIDFDDADEDEDPDDDDVDPKVLALRREIDSARKFAIDEACDVMGLASEKAFEKVSVDFREQFIRSKPFVEALLASNYTPKRRETMGTNLEFSKEAIAEFLNEVVAPRSPQAKALVKKILPQLQSLNHSWAKNPPDNMYTTNPKTGLQTLDINNLNLLKDEYLYPFFDPELSDFTDTNASYSPAFAYGADARAERVDFTPAMLALADVYPLVGLEVLGHEVGHMIGPNVSKINGFDMNEVYAKLIECLKSEKSIKMQPGQQDETIADWLSAEVLARYIGKLEPEKRRNAVIEAVQASCSFAEDGDLEEGDLIATHPESSIRLNGIYGANAQLREFLGCPKDDPNQQYQTCTLDGPAKGDQ